MINETELENYFCEGQMDIEDYMRGETTMNNGIILIGLDKIKPHPKNPRLNIGDVTELSDSIRKNGIMQNLTVMHDPDDPEGYICLIGHRRMTAAAQAGLTEAPCRVVQIDEKEQIAMMLQENIQRNDLTICEQAWGFQYMFDLGVSADEIAEKTGLNRSTVYHRLNIAKLDKAELEKKVSDEEFQLTFKDLMELERIEDIKERNRVLKESTNKNELNYKVTNALRRQKEKKNAEILIKAAEEAGLKEAPKEYKKNRWGGKYESGYGVWLYDHNSKESLLKAFEIPKMEGQLYYDIDGSIFRIVWERKEPEKAKQRKTAYEIRREKEKECLKKLQEFDRNMKRNLKDYVHAIIGGKLISPNYEESMDVFWGTLMALEVRLDYEDAVNFFSECKKRSWERTEEENEEGIDWYDSLDTLSQMIIMLYMEMEETHAFKEYNGVYSERFAKDLIAGYEAFSLFGIELTEEEEKYLNGTSEMFYVEEEEDEDDEEDDGEFDELEEDEDE